jgi:hypothetical protein
MAGVKGLDELGAVALAEAVSCSKALTALNLAFVKLNDKAVDAFVEVSRGRSTPAVWLLTRYLRWHLLCSTDRRLMSVLCSPRLACFSVLGTLLACLFKE